MKCELRHHPPMDITNLINKVIKDNELTNMFNLVGGEKDESKCNISMDFKYTGGYNSGVAKCYFAVTLQGFAVNVFEVTAGHLLSEPVVFTMQLVKGLKETVKILTIDLNDLLSNKTEK